MSFSTPEAPPHVELSPPTGLETLLSMLAYRRPAGSKTERRFIREFIEPLGVERDAAGNLIKRIGDAPVLWSSHTDTVHKEGGMQRLVVAGDIVTAGGASNCLGADCTTGVWLMVEMIKAGKPGLYVFHREEEWGGLGSAHIADNQPGLLAGIQFAIAFDRKGRSSIITHQAGGRCCSEAFALSLADELGLGMVPDSGGTFTDTANYTHLVPECTNISVGYAHQHTVSETQDLAFAATLLAALLRMDVTNLVAERDPTLFEPTYPSSRAPWDYTTSTWRDDEYWAQQAEPVPSRGRTILSILRDYPDEIADYLEEQGINADDLLYEVWQRGAVVKQ